MANQPETPPNLSAAQEPRGDPLPPHIEQTVGAINRLQIAIIVLRARCSERWKR